MSMLTSAVRFISHPENIHFITPPKHVFQKLIRQASQFSTRRRTERSAWWTGLLTFILFIFVTTNKLSQRRKQYSHSYCSTYEHFTIDHDELPPAYDTLIKGEVSDKIQY